MMGKLRYPPCQINPKTNKPYIRHKWMIPTGAEVLIKLEDDEPVYYYRVRCERCGFNDPKPPRH